MAFNFPHLYLSKAVSPRTLAKKKERGICRHHGCSRDRREGRSDCDTCHGRKGRMANPVRYYFREVKKSAKKRGIPCGLTFEEFEKFDRETGYTKGVGTGPDDLTIDRVDPARGYESGNLRALTHRANSARLVEGITDPRQPIAEALALVAGKGKNWRSYLRLSEDVLLKVDLINKQALPSDLDVPEGNCPF